MSKIYANAEAFRNALEDRLRAVAQERGVQIQGAPQGSDRAPACQAIVTGLSTPELNVAFEKLEWFWGELGSFDRP